MDQRVERSDVQQDVRGDDPMVPLYARSELNRILPRTEIPDGPMDPESAYQLIKDEVNFDASPGQNLASFVCTWMDGWAERLAQENVNKNFIDHEEYPASSQIEKRIIWMEGKMFGADFAPEDANPDTAKGFYGSLTIGSSEAIMLGLIAHRKTWREKHEMLRKKHGLSRASLLFDRPFVVMSTHVHTCWDKFCKYFGAGALYAPMSEETDWVLQGESVEEILSAPILNGPYWQEINAICHYPEECYSDLEGRTVGELVMAVGAISGTTFTGRHDDVVSIGNAIDAYCEAHDIAEECIETCVDAETGATVSKSVVVHTDIPIHVDAASGGFLLPFTDPDKTAPFDFTAHARVRSINTSNHKFGLVYPGLGSVVFRNKDVVHSDLIYKIDYLGGSFFDYTINFSRGTSMVLMQYYNFLRLGWEGYKDIHVSSVTRANEFLNWIAEDEILGKYFEPISDNTVFPIVVLRWNRHLAHKPGWTMRELTKGLEAYDWVVPAYYLPTDHHSADASDPETLEVMRMVIRMSISSEKLNGLLRTMRDVVTELEGRYQNAVNESEQMLMELEVMKGLEDEHHMEAVHNAVERIVSLTADKFAGASDGRKDRSHG